MQNQLKNLIVDTLLRTSSNITELVNEVNSLKNDTLIREFNELLENLTDCMDEINSLLEILQDRNSSMESLKCNCNSVSSRLDLLAVSLGMTSEKWIERVDKMSDDFTHNEFNDSDSLTIMKFCCILNDRATSIYELSDSLYKESLR